jgi:hypothetical protein
MMGDCTGYWYRHPGPIIGQPHGTFDNLMTMRREHWYNGKLEQSISEAYITAELARPPSIALLGTLHPWGYFPDLPR